jgi:hypothetical protein
MNIIQIIRFILCFCGFTRFCAYDSPKETLTVPSFSIVKPELALGSGPLPAQFAEIIPLLGKINKNQITIKPTFPICKWDQLYPISSQFRPVPSQTHSDTKSYKFCILHIFFAIVCLAGLYFYRPRSSPGAVEYLSRNQFYRPPRPYYYNSRNLDPYTWRFDSDYAYAPRPVHDRLIEWPNTLVPHAEPALEPTVPPHQRSHRYCYDLLARVTAPQQPTDEQVNCLQAMFMAADGHMAKPALDHKIITPEWEDLSPTQMYLTERVKGRPLGTFNLVVKGVAGCSKTTMYLAFALVVPTVICCPSNELVADVYARAEQLGAHVQVFTQHTVLDQHIGDSVLLVDELWLYPEYHIRAIAAVARTAIGFGDPYQTNDLGFGQQFQAVFTLQTNEPSIELSTSFTVPQDVIRIAHDNLMIPKHWTSVSPVQESLFLVRGATKFDCPVITMSRECKAGFSTDDRSYTVVTAQGARFKNVVLHICDRDLSVLSPSGTFNSGGNRNPMLWTMLSRHSNCAYIDFNRPTFYNFNITINNFADNLVYLKHPKGVFITPSPYKRFSPSQYSSCLPSSALLQTISASTPPAPQRPLPPPPMTAHSPLLWWPGPPSTLPQTSSCPEHSSGSSHSAMTRRFPKSSPALILPESTLIRPSPVLPSARSFGLLFAPHLAPSISIGMPASGLHLSPLGATTVSLDVPPILPGSGVLTSPPSP